MVAAHRARVRRDPLFVPTPIAPLGVGVTVPQGLGGAGPTGIQWMPAIGPNHVEYEYGYHYWNWGNDYINFTLFDDVALWLRQCGDIKNLANVEVLMRPVELLYLTGLVRSNTRYIVTKGAPAAFSPTVSGHITQFGYLAFQSSLRVPPHTIVIQNTDTRDRRMTFTPRLTVLPLRKRSVTVSANAPCQKLSELGRALVVTNIRSLHDEKQSPRASMV